jgi:hypothetical protein
MFLLVFVPAYQFDQVTKYQGVKIDEIFPRWQMLG